MEDEAFALSRRRRSIRRRFPAGRLILTLGVAWGLSMAGCDNGAVDGQVAPVAELEAKVVAFCERGLARLDCACFWSRAAQAFSAGTVDAILTTLAEREQYGPMITRGRLEQVSGEANTRLIGRALYDCVDLGKPPPRAAGAPP
jgi:hypothetical protein